MRRLTFFLSALCVLSLAACRQNDEIETYRVSKEAEPSMPMAGTMPVAAPSGQETAPAMPSGSDMNMPMQPGMAPAASAKEIQWDVPAGWKEQPASSMRVGSFLVTGENGQTADVSIVPLSGVAGGDLANINRWRGQIQLSPIADGDLDKNSETMTLGGRRMLVVDFVSQDLLVNNRYKRRLIAAIYTPGDRSWFFKMMGEDQTVESAKPAFLKFLKTLRFPHE